MPKATVTLGPVDYGMVAAVRNHEVIIDELVTSGGHDSGPGPTEFLCVALASCTVATMKMYANRKQWRIDSLVVEVDKGTVEDKKNIFKRIIHLKGQLDETQLNRLLQIADSCPVHKILSQGNTIETKLG